MKTERTRTAGQSHAWTWGADRRRLDLPACFSVCRRHDAQEADVKGLIFDLDGTLVDTLEDIAAACNAMLEKEGFPTHSTAAYRKFVGNGFTTLVRKALPAQAVSDPGQLEDLVSKARLEYDKKFLHKSNPYPFIHEVLTELCKNGMRLGVLSNKPDPWTKPIIAHFFGDIPFAAVRGGLPGVPLKPDPAAVLDMLHVMNLAPEDCLYVGDSHVDIQTAHHAGMRVVSVSWGFSSRPELAALHPWRIVDEARELLTLSREA